MVVPSALLGGLPAARAPLAEGLALPERLFVELGGRAAGREFWPPRTPALELVSPTAAGPLELAAEELFEGPGPRGTDAELDFALFASVFEAETARRFEPADEAAAAPPTGFLAPFAPDADAEVEFEDLGLGTLEPEMARSTCAGSGVPSALSSERSGCWPRPLLRAESDSAFRP